MLMHLFTFNKCAKVPEYMKSKVISFSPIHLLLHVYLLFLFMFTFTFAFTFKLSLNLPLRPFYMVSSKIDIRNLTKSHDVQVCCLNYIIMTINVF